MAVASIPRGAASTLRRNPAAAWRHLDAGLVGVTLTLAALGLLMVYSATRGPEQPYDTSFLQRQVFFVVVGVAVMAVVALVDYRHFRDWAVVIYGGVVLLLAGVISPVGSSSKGTQGWFQLGSFQLQPSELAKLALIVGLAAFCSYARTELDFRRLLLALALAAVPMVLILLQPDLGTVIVFAAITMGMLLVAGAQPRHIVALTVVGVLGILGALNSNLLEDYQKERLTSFLDQEGDLQEATYSLNQSKNAIGAGGFVGQGLFEGTQTRLSYVPEQHTDFIFTAVGEELGFLGAGTLLALFSVLAWRIWRTAQLARDPFGALICTGVLALLLFQVFQNVGMTIGIMPITGIPLPFLSYGGSSTIMAFAAMGLVLNVHMRRFS